MLKIKKSLTCLIGCLAIGGYLYSQTTPPGSRRLSADEIRSFCTDSLKNVHGIRFPIHTVFEFSDKKSQYRLILAEHVYKQEADKQEMDSIQAVWLHRSGNIWNRKMQVLDFIKPGPAVGGFADYSIWFWTRYFSLSDIDGDGAADPILVFGTHGDNGKEDGKIKIMVCYRDKKYVIRHQNGALDYDRNTHVDAAFYKLPATIQNRVKTLIKQIMNDGNGIFPAGWERAMKAKKTWFDEQLMNP